MENHVNPVTSLDLFAHIHPSVTSVLDGIEDSRDHHRIVVIVHTFSRHHHRGAKPCCLIQRNIVIHHLMTVVINNIASLKRKVIDPAGVCFHPIRHHPKAHEVIFLDFKHNGILLYLMNHTGMIHYFYMISTTGCLLRNKTSQQISQTVACTFSPPAQKHRTVWLPQQYRMSSFHPYSSPSASVPNCATQQLTGAAVRK